MADQISLETSAGRRPSGKFTRLVTEIPGPKSRWLYNRSLELIPQGVFHVSQIAVSHSQGALVTDLDGNTYIDFTGGIGVLNVGHRAAEVVAAIKDQADRYLHTCFHVLLYEPYVSLAEKLNEITPGNFVKKTFFVNSGAEAVDNAVKIARHYTRRPALLAFAPAFHGRTLMALSLTGQVMPYKQGFGPFVPEVYRLPFAYCYRCSFGLEYPSCGLHCAEHLERMFQNYVAADSVAALITEPVLGEGGFVVPPPGFFKRVKEICEGHGILLIADEIQSGFARTGKMFAMEHFGVEPDIVLTGKSLAGGTVLSGVTGRAEVMDSPQVGGLGGTYGGNPLSCQAALAAIHIIEKEGLVTRAQEIGERARGRLREMQEKYQIIGDVRGLGAMVGMELVTDRDTKRPATQETASILKRCQERGLLLLRAGADHNVVRLLMPLVISKDEIDEGLSILETVLKEVSEGGDSAGN